LALSYLTLSVPTETTFNDQLTIFVPIERESFAVAIPQIDDAFDLMLVRSHATFVVGFKTIEKI
jgi:hypothetical protein